MYVVSEVECTIVFMYLALLKLTTNVNNLNSKTDYSIR